MSVPDEEPVVRVLAAVIRRQGRYLLCLRPPQKRHCGLWEFPGGKLEAKESLAQAARRELWEELGVEVTECGPLLFSHQEAESPFRIEFVPVEIAGEPRALEHPEIRWVSVEELKEMPLAPSDRAFAEWSAAGIK
jgi:8-oxo-dGTP diphosphatase